MEISRKNVLAILVAWAILPAAYVAWGIQTIADSESMLFQLAPVAWIVVILMYVWINSFISHKVPHFDLELMYLELLASIVAIAIAIAILLEQGVTVEAEISAVFAIISVVCAVRTKRNQLFWHELEGIKQAFRDNWGLLLLLIMLVLLSYDSNFYQFKWDGLQYYHVIANESNLISLSSVALYGHISMFSGFLYRICGVLCRNIGYGMFVANVLLLLGSTCAVYGIVRHIVPNKRSWTYVLASAVYAFSPYLLGMVNYYSIDYFCVCMMPILIYFILKRYWIFSLLVGWAFCFSKEPAIIAYSGLWFGVAIVDLWSCDGAFATRLKTVLSRIHYYFMLIPIILWVATYKYMGAWNGGEGGFKVDIAYVVDKLKVFCIFNLNWIITTFVVIGLIVVLLRNNLRGYIKYFVPLIISNIFVLLFNCAFATANHPRYIDSFISVHIVIALLCTIVMLSDKHENICVGVCTFLAVCMLVSSFATIDPISLKLFDYNDVGSAKLITTNGMPLGDACMYNKQLLWEEEAIDMAMNDAIDTNSCIVFPVNDGSLYAYDGMTREANIHELESDDIQFWDTKHAMRVYKADIDMLSKDHVVPISVGHVRSDADLDIYKPDDTISIIYIKGINDYAVPQSRKLIDSSEYSYRGWIVTKDTYAAE